MTDFIPVTAQSRTTPFYGVEIEVTVEIDGRGKARISGIGLHDPQYFREVLPGEFEGLGPFDSADAALDEGLRIGVQAAGH